MLKMTRIAPAVIILIFAAAIAKTQPCATDAARIIYPVPRKACLDDAVKAPPLLKFSSATKFFTTKNASHFATMFAGHSIKFEKGAARGASIVFIESSDRHAGVHGDEGYKIAVQAKPFKITVAARSETGFLYACLTIADMFDAPGAGAGIYTGTVDDYPTFPYRGVLEGGYDVWSYENRLSVLKWMPSVKFNFFIYAPKDDPYFRRQWRKLYPPEIIDQFRNYLRICNENNVVFSFSLSPALSMEYSNPEEFRKLVAKYRQIQALGVNRFGIFFDDVLPYLSTPADRKRFRHIAEAEVYVSNKLLAELKKKNPAAKLFFVPNQYWGWTPTTYFKIIKEKLNPEIEIGWTGEEICSVSISAEDCRKFEKVTGHKPAIGDNFSPFGPLVKRAPDIYPAATSFVNNPYNFAGDANSESSKFVNATIADYSWNSAGYEPDRSFNMAALKLAGGETQGEALLLALRMEGHPNVKSKYFDSITQLVEKLRNSSGKNTVVDEGVLAVEIEKCARETEALKQSLAEPLFKAQMSPFLDKASKALSGAATALNYRTENKTGAELADEIKKALGL